MPRPVLELPDTLPESAWAALISWLPGQRWFAGKARRIRDVKEVASVSVGAARLWEIEVTFEEGEAERYALPVCPGSPSLPHQALLANLGKETTLCDAVYEPSFRKGLFQSLAEPPKDGTEFSVTRGALLSRLFTRNEMPVSRVLPVEQSNTSLIYGERLFVKLYRKRVEGMNPDAEVMRYLSEAAGFRHVPAFGGEVRWRDAALALAVELRPNQGDAWSRALREFQRWMGDEQTLEKWRQMTVLLGRRTGGMHLALANPKFHKGQWAGFAVETMSREEIEKLRQLRGRAKELSLALLRKNGPSLPSVDPSMVEQILVSLEDHAGYLMQRIHGDYHLGQVLCTEDDFLIVDFEGEPSRTLTERRAKHPPIRDIAGMLRSFHYAAHATRGEATLEQADTWAAACQRAFLQGWRETVRGTPVADERLLRYYLIEKALYEVDYELNNRPDWLHIPLRGLQAVGDAAWG